MVLRQSTLGGEGERDRGDGVQGGREVEICMEE